MDFIDIQKIIRDKEIDDQVEELMKPKIRNGIKIMVDDGMTIPYGFMVTPDEMEYIKSRSKK